MSRLTRIVGAIVLLLWLFGWLGVIDFYVCVGPMDSCIQRTPPRIV